MNSFKEYYLNEMLVIGNKPKENDHIIAFDKWIWILSEEDQELQTKMEDIVDKLSAVESGDIEYIKNNIGDDIWSFLQAVIENFGDVLVGQVNGKNLYLHKGQFQLDPKSSVLIKKVVTQLKLSKASYMDDAESTTVNVTKKKITGNIPSIAYHGTSSNYFDKIMRTGLRASQADSNYEKQGIVHYDLVFFSTRFGEAMDHGIYTANLKGGRSIVLELEIPNKNLVIPDYDVEKLTGTDQYYSDIYGKANGTSYKKDPFKLSKEFGIYGYKGRIPASFIKKVYVAMEDKDYYEVKDFKKMNPKQLQRLIDQGYLD